MADKKKSLAHFADKFNVEAPPGYVPGRGRGCAAPSLRPRACARRALHARECSQMIHRRARAAAIRASTARSVVGFAEPPADYVPRGRGPTAAGAGSAAGSGSAAGAAPSTGGEGGAGSSSFALGAEDKGVHFASTERFEETALSFDRKEAGYEIEPFNLHAEREGGHFDSDFNYVPNRVRVVRARVGRGAGGCGSGALPARIPPAPRAHARRPPRAPHAARPVRRSARAQADGELDKADGPVSDAWLASMDELKEPEEKTRRRAEAARRQAEREAQADARARSADVPALCAQCAALLGPGETVLQALRRLGAPSRPAAAAARGAGRGRARARGGEDGARADTRTADERARFEQLTELASTLLDAGEVDVYSRSREQLLGGAARGGQGGASGPLAPALAPADGGGGAVGGEYAPAEGGLFRNVRTGFLFDPASQLSWDPSVAQPTYWWYDSARGAYVQWTGSAGAPAAANGGEAGARDGAAGAPSGVKRPRDDADGAAVAAD